MTQAATQATRQRLSDELEALEAAVAGAPDEHQAVVATRKLRDWLTTCESPDWYDVHQGYDARNLCNEIAKGTVPGICKPW